LVFSSCLPVFLFKSIHFLLLALGREILPSAPLKTMVAVDLDASYRYLFQQWST